MLSGPTWITQSSQQRFVSGVVVCQLVCRLAVDIFNIILVTHCLYADLLTNLTLKICESTLQTILLCNCSLSLNVCNLWFLSTTVLQGSVATRVNDGRIFNDFLIANLLLSVMVKEFRRSIRIWQSYGKKIKWHFFPDTVYMRVCRFWCVVSLHYHFCALCMHSLFKCLKLSIFYTFGDDCWWPDCSFNCIYM